MYIFIIEYMGIYLRIVTLFNLFYRSFPTVYFKKKRKQVFDFVNITDKFHIRNIKLTAVVI